MFLPGESPWAEEPGALQSMGRKEQDTNERLSTQHNLPQQYSLMFKIIERTPQNIRDFVKVHTWDGPFFPEGIF